MPGRRLLIAIVDDEAGVLRALERLVRSAGQVVTHRQLLADVWGPEFTEHTHYLRLYMGQLRAKLEADPAEPRLLLTDPGVGYRLAEATE